MKLSNLAKRMILTIVIIVLVCVLASVIYYRSLGFIPFLLGSILGTAVSILKVFMLENTVNKVVGMESKHAGNYVSLQHILRLLITGVALYLGAVVPQISLWGVLAGILAFQLAVFNVKFTSNKKKEEIDKGGE